MAMKKLGCWQLLACMLSVIAIVSGQQSHSDNSDASDVDYESDLDSAPVDSAGCYSWKDVEDGKQLFEQSIEDESAQSLKAADEWFDFTNIIMLRCLQLVDLNFLDSLVTEEIKVFYQATKLSLNQSPDQFKIYFNLGKDEDEQVASEYKREHKDLFERIVTEKNLDRNILDYDCVIYTDKYKAQMLRASRWAHVENMYPQQVYYLLVSNDRLLEHSLMADMCEAYLDSD